MKDPTALHAEPLKRQQVRSTGDLVGIAGNQVEESSAADDDQLHSGPGDRYVEPSRIGEKRRRRALWI